MLKINESTVLLDLEAENCNDVILKLADALYDQGFVSDVYGGQTCLREEIHPTGLPTKPFCIAFPHADCDGVIESALGVAILKNPVLFKNMAEPDEDLGVELVIMLANADPAEQIQSLKNLARLFGQGEKLQALKDQSSAKDVVKWLTHELHLDDPLD